MDISSFRAARERAGYGQEEMAQILEVRPEYIEALERGELPRLLGPSYVRSILVRYAVCVDLDPEQALAMPLTGRPDFPEMDDAVATVPARVHTEVRAPRRRSVSKRRVVVTAAAAGLVLAATLGALQLISIFPRGDERSTATAQTTALPLGGAGSLQARAAASTLGTTTTTTLSTFASSEPAAQAVTVAVAASTTTTAKKGAFTVVFAPSAEVWLEVTSEKSGTLLYSGVKQAGEKLRIELTRPILAVVGKPEAVAISIDGVEAQAPHAQVWRVSATGVETVK